MNQAVNTDLQVNFNQHERARMDFVSSLRAHVLTRMAPAMREHYETTVAPRLARTAAGEPQDGPSVHAAMREEKPFKFYSAARNSAQEMVFASVIEGVEREVDRLNSAAANLRGTAATGSLTLDPSLTVPKNVSDIDVHLSPGSYHTEYRDEDVATGAIYDNSIRVFTFGQFGRDLNDIGATMANYVRLKFPDFRPERILDCGCSIGHNTLPWAEAFPDTEVTGIDVAPAVLRYGHARAQSMGIPAHFRQMNATALDYPDNSFDVVFSSMFLHELPLKDIRAYLKEARRVLRPGGLLWNMELPPNNQMPPYESFYLDWDSFYNNEPYYKGFRDQDYRELVADAGFGSDAFIQATLPRYTFVGEEAFARDINAPATFDTLTGRMDPRGTRWYGFGAWKSA